MHDGLIVNISGIVESCVPVHFVKEPAVDIVIRCFDPDFLDLAPTHIEGVSTSTNAETMYRYEGTVETGVQFTLNVNRALTEFTIYHRPPDGSLRVQEFALTMQAGDELKIGSVPGDKFVSLVRGPTILPALYGMDSRSPWLELSQGDNYIRVYAEGAPIPYAIDYTTRYGGL